MSLHDLYLPGCFAVLAAAALTFPALLWIAAPYGRHGRGGWGPTLPARVVWVVQESPSVLLFAVVYFLGARSLEPVPLVLFALWQAHYVQRTFVFPFLMRLQGKRDPVATMAMAIVFNVTNASLNAWAISSGPAARAAEWLTDPRFLAGVALFVTGYVINRHSDAVLRRLRKPGETGYRIPQGGLFRWVTSPNYLGEILEWAGWALASFSLAGLAFAVFTAANLVPRARTHHEWYHRTFPDYPPERRVIVPFLY
jgi:protein-S-isoprenylcysteine O-methyltransferase Ste14